MASVDCLTEVLLTKASVIDDDASTSSRESTNARRGLLKLQADILETDEAVVVTVDDILMVIK